MRKAPQDVDARDREAQRRALDNAIASLPVRLPNPELDGAICVNPVTWQESPTFQTFTVTEESNEDR